MTTPASSPVYRILFCFFLFFLSCSCSKQASTSSDGFNDEKSAIESTEAHLDSDFADKPSPTNIDEAKIVDVSAVSFYKDFKSSQSPAIEKYRNTHIQLSGVIGNFGTLVDSTKRRRAYAALTAEDTERPYLSSKLVFCFFNEPFPWVNASVGDDVTIRGVLVNDGEFGALKGGLDKCRVLTTTGKPTRRTTPMQLVVEYSSDPELFRKNWEHKSVVVSGTVLEIQGAPYTPQTLFKGFGGNNLSVKYSSTWPDDFVKVGDEIEIIGLVGLFRGLNIMQAERIDDLEAGLGK